MTIGELVDRIAEGIARQQNYYLSQTVADYKKTRYPSLSQLFRNPGLLACGVDTVGRVMSWRGVRNGKPVYYPYSMMRVNCEARYFVDFGKDLIVDGVAEELPEDEGWRCLRVAITQAVNRGDTLKKLITDHANRNGTPIDGYVEAVSVRVGVNPRIPLIGVVKP